MSKMKSEDLTNISKKSIYHKFDIKTDREETVIPASKHLMYLPIIEPTETDVGISYLTYLRLSVIDHGDYLTSHTLAYPEHPLLNKDDWMEQGKKKYRDTIIPEFVHKDLASGKCVKLILDYSLEGFHKVDWNYVSELFGVEQSKIVWLTSVTNPEWMDAQSDVTVIYHNFWEQFVHQQTNRDIETIMEYQQGLRQQFKDIDELKIRKHHGLNYNRRPHPNRVYLLTKLISANILDKISYSWGGIHMILPEDWYQTTDRTLQDQVTQERTQQFIDREQEELWTNGEKAKIIGGEKDWESMTTLVNMKEKSFPGEDLKINKADSLNFDHVSSAYFHIVSETFALHNDPDCFLSEKAYKPLACGMPFVIWGPRNSVLTLAKQGYHTFEDWINHDYDGIEDSASRMGRLIEEIERLCAIPPEEWSIMLKEMLPKLIDNAMMIRNLSNESLRRIPPSDYVKEDFNVFEFKVDGLDKFYNDFITLDMDRIL